jgi:hypothetical protein
MQSRRTVDSTASTDNRRCSCKQRCVDGCFWRVLFVTSTRRALCLEEAARAAGNGACRSTGSDDSVRVRSSEAQFHFDLHSDMRGRHAGAERRLQARDRVTDRARVWLQSGVGSEQPRQRWAIAKGSAKGQMEGKSGPARACPRMCQQEPVACLSALGAADRGSGVPLLPLLPLCARPHRAGLLALAGRVPGRRLRRHGGRGSTAALHDRTRHSLPSPRSCTGSMPGARAALRSA